MNRSSLNHVLALGLTVIGVVVTLTEFNILRTLFTVPLIFALPGYAILAAWSPKRLAAFPANILFTVTLSIAAAAIGGLVLNLLPWGLQTLSWTMWLAGITILHLTAALLRGESAAMPDNETAPTRFRPHQLAFIVGAVALSFFALYLAREGALVQERPGFTQLWLTEGQNTNSIDVGVQNQEGYTVSYRLVLEGDGVGAGDRIEREFEVAQNERWEINLELPSDHGAVIDAYLYRSDNSAEIYRTTRLWLADAE